MVTWLYTVPEEPIRTGKIKCHGCCLCTWSVRVILSPSQNISKNSEDQRAQLLPEASIITVKSDSSTAVCAFTLCLFLINMVQISMHFKITKKGCISPTCQMGGKWYQTKLVFTACDFIWYGSLIQILSSCPASYGLKNGLNLFPTSEFLGQSPSNSSQVFTR